MSDGNKRSWRVLADGFMVSVIADDWVLSGNGLEFYSEGRKIAHFITWSWFTTDDCEHSVVVKNKVDIC